MYRMLQGPSSKPLQLAVATILICLPGGIDDLLHVEYGRAELLTVATSRPELEDPVPTYPQLSRLVLFVF